MVLEIGMICGLGCNKRRYAGPDTLLVDDRLSEIPIDSGTTEYLVGSYIIEDKVYSHMCKLLRHDQPIISYQRSTCCLDTLFTVGR